MAKSIKRLKKLLKELESSVEKEPYVVFEGGSDVLISDSAKELFNKKKVKEDEFVNWLNLIARHLIKNNFFKGFQVFMIRLPDRPEDIFAILREEGRAEKAGFGLTKREKETLTYSVRGLTNKEIAACLNISAGTVNAHLDSIYRKMGVSNRLEATLAALKCGLVPYHLWSKTPR